MTTPQSTREKLCDELLDYARRHPGQAACARSMMRFVADTPDCFYRTHASGHITSSAWLLSPDGNRALLTLHRKLGKWLQLGGHADGDTDTLHAAIREAQEESGISGIVPVSTEIFDVDIHRIPMHPQTNEAEHWHYDVRYLLRAPHDHFCISPESCALRWFTHTELLSPSFPVDESVRRLAKKATLYNKQMSLT